jgi:hypothetical protein
LAMLASYLFGNTGKFVPSVGLLVCGSAMGFGIRHNATGVAAVDQLRQFVDRFKPASAPAPIVNPAEPAPSHAPSPAPISEEKPVGSGTIFDMTAAGKSSQSPPQASTPSAPVPVPGAGPTVSAVAGTSAKERYTAAMVAVMQAHVKVDSARAALIPALSQNQAYQAAMTELSAADAALQSARANDAPATPELVAAAQRYVDAKAAVQKIANAAAATDPQTIAARQALMAAQSDLRAAQEDMAAERKH